MRSRCVKPMLIAALLIVGLAFVFAATPATAVPFVRDFEVIGSGTAGNTCQVAPLTAGCISNSGGDAIGTHIGNGSYTLSVKTGALALPNSSGGSCFAADGTGDITAANGDVISFTTVGTLCEEGLLGSPYHYNGTYRIFPGTGRFDDAVGGGSLTSTFEKGGGARTFLAIDGTIDY